MRAASEWGGPHLIAERRGCVSCHRLATDYIFAVHRSTCHTLTVAYRENSYSELFILSRDTSFAPREVRVEFSRMTSTIVLRPRLAVVCVFFALAGFLASTVAPAGAQDIRSPGAVVADAPQQGAAPTLRVIERSEHSITYEFTATWRGRLRDAVNPEAYRTVLEAVGGIPWTAERLVLSSSASPPLVTVLSSEFDEAPLAFSADDAEEAGLLGPAAGVERVGIERRRPTGTFVVRFLQVDPNANVIRRYSRMLIRVDLPATAGRAESGDPQNPHLGVTQSVLASGTWFKVPVTHGGIHRIDRAFLAGLGLNPTAIDPNQIKVYGNGGAPLPALNSAPRIPDLAENPVQVIGGGDGRFDDGDAVLFYAHGPTGWTWDSSIPQSQPGWRHFVNPFTKQSHYFIRVDGPASRRIMTAAPASGVADVLSRVQGRIFAEEDLPDGMIDRDGGGSGLDWLGRDLSRTRNRITVLDTLPPDLAQGAVLFRSRVALRSEAAVPFSFLSGQQTLQSLTLSRSSTNVLFTEGTVTFSQDVAPSQRLRIDLQMSATSGNPTGWIDYVQAFYPQDLRASGDYLRFVTPGGEEGLFEFVLTGFTAEPEVWDVTQAAGARRLPVTGGGGEFRVRVTVLDPDAPRELVAFRPGSSRIRTLAASQAESVPNQNLHGIASHPDYVIITAQPFRVAADELAAHRAADGLQPAVFDIREIYNEFSSGNVDPRGMRDFVRFLYDRGPGEEPTLRNVLLFGDGNYDFRGIREGSAEVNFIPTYQSDNSSNYVSSYTSDDYFGLLAPGEGVWPFTSAGTAERLDIGIGRLPVRTAQEAADMVAKIKRYEHPDTHGAWRTRYTFLADDHLPNSWDKDLHIQNAELLSDSARVFVPGLNLQKIYMPTYTLQQTALGARYPGATADAIRSLEEGTLIWNYAGHGGTTGLADEKLITREEVRALTNFDRLTVAVTATCSFGRYDLAGERSGGEEFILNPVGGAVAIFTTSRVVYTGASPTSNNLGLNVTLNRYLLGRGSDGRPRRLGDAYQMTKATSVGAQTNSRKFNLLGDPGMRFGLPEREVRVTSVNDIPVGGQNVTASRVPDASGMSLLAESAPKPASGEGVADASGGAVLPEFRALELATIRGEVQDLSGTLDGAFQGEVEVLVYDVSRTITLPPAVPLQWTDGTFQDRRDVIYRGRASVQNGQWTTQFIVPRDISYAGGSARISAYASGAGVDGIGFSEEVQIGSESGAPLNDNEGPNIRLFLNDTTFVSGGLVGGDPVLIARLSDESGINMAGVGVGHEMRLVINGNEAEAINVGPFYSSDLDNFRRGTVRYPLANLSDGPQTLSLTAWDVVNNSSTASLDFVIEDSDRLRVEHAYPYPNPTTGPTRFVFEHNQAPGTPARVQIRIYTINGRPIRTLDGVETLPDGVLPGSPVQIAWDGRDEDFDELATGIYLYRVRVEVDRGDGERRVAERIERLAIIR